MACVEWKYRDEIKEKYGFNNRQFCVFFSLTALCPIDKWPRELLLRMHEVSLFEPRIPFSEYAIIAKWILDGEPQ